MLLLAQAAQKVNLICKQKLEWFGVCRLLSFQQFSQRARQFWSGVLNTDSLDDNMYDVLGGIRVSEEKICVAHTHSFFW